MAADDVDTRRRLPGTIILRVVAIRVGDTAMPEEIVANVDIEPQVAATLLATADGQKAWCGWAIEGARKIYARMLDKGWI